MIGWVYPCEASVSFGCCATIVFSFHSLFNGQNHMNMAIIHLRSQMFPLDVWGFPEKKRCRMNEAFCVSNCSIFSLNTNFWKRKGHTIHSHYFCPFLKTISLISLSNNKKATVIWNAVFIITAKQVSERTVCFTLSHEFFFALVKTHKFQTSVFWNKGWSLLFMINTINIKINIIWKF